MAPKRNPCEPSRAKGKVAKTNKKPKRISQNAKGASGKGCNKCRACEGKGYVRGPQKRVPKANGKRRRRLPKNNHFPMFFCHVAQRIRERIPHVRYSGKVIMEQAADCWRKLSAGQKMHFRDCVMPGVISRRRSNPGPRPGNPGPSSGSPGPNSGNPGPCSGNPGPNSGNPSPDSGNPSPNSGNPGPSPGNPGPSPGDCGNHPGPSSSGGNSDGYGFLVPGKSFP